MWLVYALPLLIALGLAWLAVRYRVEKRREKRLRDRQRRQPAASKVKSRGNTERSEMRADEDATTVMRTIKRKHPPTAAQSQTARTGPHKARTGPDKL